MSALVRSSTEAEKAEIQIVVRSSGLRRLSTEVFCAVKQSARIVYSQRRLLGNDQCDNPFAAVVLNGDPFARSQNRRSVEQESMDSAFRRAVSCQGLRRFSEDLQNA